jgi:DNA-binding LacI/PurR family transcriptional regulator
MTATSLNQKQIAAKLGLSPAAISLALNDPETTRVSEDNKERIFSLANSSRRGGYSKADTVLFLTDGQELHFFYGHSILSGAQSRAAELGLKFEVINTEQNLERIVANRDVKGLLLVNAKLPENLQKQPSFLRTVTLNAYHRSEFAGIAISADHFEGMREAVEYLVKMGHRKIGYLGYQYPKPTVTPSRERERATLFLEAMEFFDLPVPEHAVQLIPDPAHETIDRSADIREVLRLWQRESGPTGIVVFNDLMGAKVINLAFSLGLNVPKDLSVVGIDNEPLCEHLSPRLTSLSPRFYEMGRLGVNLVSDIKLWHGENLPCRMSIPSRLIVRDSVRDLSQS